MSASFSDTAIGVTVFFVLKKIISPNQILYSNLALVWKVFKKKKGYIYFYMWAKSILLNSGQKSEETIFSFVE